MPFPNFEGKQDKTALLLPESFLEYMEKTGRNVKMPRSLIFIYSNHQLSEFREQLNIPIATKYWPLYKVSGTRGKVGVVLSFIGAPAATTLLEEAIAMGAKHIISMGTAGGLQQSLSHGDIVVCDKAIRDEGTSYHYLAPSKFALPSKKLTEALIKTLGDHGLDFEVGPSWTIDAPYRETKAEVERYRKEGVYTVEMEASALFAVGKFRKVDVASAFVIGDILGETWNPAFEQGDIRKNLFNLFKACVKTLEGFDE